MQTNIMKYNFRKQGFLCLKNKNGGDHTKEANN